MFSEKSELSFNDVPKAVAHLINKVDKNRNPVKRRTTSTARNRPMVKPQRPVQVPP